MRCCVDTLLTPTKRKYEEEQIIEKKERKQEEKEAELKERLLISNTEEHSELVIGEETVAEDREKCSSDKVKRNYMSIKHTAAASLRFQNSSYQTAVTCTAFLRDLIDAGIVPKNKAYLALDKNKVLRAQNLLLKEAVTSGESDANEDTITAVFFDGRKDNTKVLLYNETTQRYHQRIVKEEHITVTSEPDGSYRMHFTPPEATPANKPAKQVAVVLHDWLVEHGQDTSVLVVGGDSTNSMSGWKGGSIAWLEKLLNRKLFWVICQIHTNELPLRHLIENIDGKTSSKGGFSGPIGKKLPEVNSFVKNLQFPTIPLLQPLVNIPDEILDQMSTDAKLSYRLVKALSIGEMSPELAGMKAGPLCHSRWLTTGMAVMFLWTSDHGFKGETLDKLKDIVTFVVQVYFPMFFEIKVKHTIVDAPKHIVTQLKLVKQQSMHVQEIVKPFVQSSAWFAHSEPLLLTLLTSEDQDDREFAVKTIKELRKGKETGDTGVRPRKTPCINMSATSLKDLIDWNKETVLEPIFTCKMSLCELEDLRETPFEAPYYPNHTQSTERAVQQVAQAAESVCGQEKRDGYVRARIAHRETVSKFVSKKDSMKIFDS